MSCYDSHCTCRQILGSNPYFTNFTSKTSLSSTEYSANDTSIKIILYIKCQKAQDVNSYEEKTSARDWEEGTLPF